MAVSTIRFNELSESGKIAYCDLCSALLTDPYYTRDSEIGFYAIVTDDEEILAVGATIEEAIKGALAQVQ